MSLQITEHLVHLFCAKCIEELMLAAKLRRKKPFLEPVFGLSVLGHCRNMVVQHGDQNMKLKHTYIYILFSIPAMFCR